MLEAYDISEDDEGAAKPLTGAAKALVLLASVPSGDTPKASQRRPARIASTREVKCFIYHIIRSESNEGNRGYMKRMIYVRYESPGMAG